MTKSGQYSSMSVMHNVKVQCPLKTRKDSLDVLISIRGILKKTPIMLGSMLALQLNMGVFGPFQTPCSAVRLRLLNRFFIFVFCFRQQPFYSTELNSTSETKSC